MTKPGTTAIIVLFLVVSLFSGCVQEQDAQEASTTLKKTPDTTTTTIMTTTTSTTTTTTTSTTTTTRPVVVDPDIKVSLSSDKSIYHSNELMNLTAVMESENYLEGAKIRIYGINATFYRIEKTLDYDVPEGVSARGFTYRAPRCYGCAGIRPGTYLITFDVVYEGEVVAADTIEIEMQN